MSIQLDSSAGVKTEADPLALKLTGGSLTGKLTVGAGTTVAPINIGTGVSPSTFVNGDLWITSTSLSYRDSTGVSRIIPALASSNAFTNYQTISQSNSTQASLQVTQTGAGGGVTVSNSSSGIALKITQTGTGESLRVEDETSVDATPFVVSNSGRVGVGIAPDATVALTVDSTGIKFNSTTFNPTGTGIASAPYALYDKELLITVNGVNYAVLARIV